MPARAALPAFVLFQSAGTEKENEPSRHRYLIDSRGLGSGDSTFLALMLSVANNDAISYGKSDHMSVPLVWKWLPSAPIVPPIARRRNSPEHIFAHCESIGPKTVGYWTLVQLTRQDLFLNTVKLFR